MPSPPTARPGDPLPREQLPEPYGGLRQPQLDRQPVGPCAHQAEGPALDRLSWTEVPGRAVVERLARAAGVEVTVLPRVEERDAAEAGAASAGNGSSSAVSQQLRRVLGGTRRPDLLYSGGYDVSLTA